MFFPASQAGDNMCVRLAPAVQAYKAILQLHDAENFYQIQDYGQFRLL